MKCGGDRYFCSSPALIVKNGKVQRIAKGTVNGWRNVRSG